MQNDPQRHQREAKNHVFFVFFFFLLFAFVEFVCPNVHARRPPPEARSVPEQADDEHQMWGGILLAEYHGSTIR
jgi:hypothetical protein